LVVDPDAVLALPVAFERFELVARWYPEVLQEPGSMEVEESPPGRSFDGMEAGNVLVVEESFGGLAPERPDHQHRLLRLTY
jgi:hypothetical protein